LKNAKQNDERCLTLQAKLEKIQIAALPGTQQTKNTTPLTKESDHTEEQISNWKLKARPRKILFKN
jgi:hypothetical protein